MIKVNTNQYCKQYSCLNQHNKSINKENQSKKMKISKQLQRYFRH